MLVKPLADSEEGHDSQEAHQKYETMQCFAVSQPNSFKEDGEGNDHLQPVFPDDVFLWVSSFGAAGTVNSN